MRHILLFILIAAALLSGGCAGLAPGDDSALRAQQVEVEDAAKKHGEDVRGRPAVSVNQGAYLNAAKIALRDQDKLPSIFERKVTLVEGPITIGEIAERITNLTGIPVRLAPKPNKGDKAEAAKTAESSSPIAYSGSLRGLFDSVAAKYNLFWEFSSDEGTVNFFRTKTRTFTVAASEGNIKLKSTISNKSKTGNAGGGGLFGGGNNNDVKDTDIEGAQVTEMSTEFNIWKEVVEAVNTILSSDGNAIANRAAGTITVTDTPAVLERVDAYVRQVNAKLSRQVALSVKVFNLEFSTDSNHGISLDAVFSDMQRNFKISSSAATPMTMLSGTGELTAAILETARNNGSGWGEWSGSQAIVQALRKQGNVTLVTSGSGITLNNQPFPLQNVYRTGYLAQVASNISNDIGNTTELQAGQVTTGFAMTVIPHILDGDRVILQYSLSLSSLDALKDISSGEGENKQTIQTPEVSTRSFMQRVSLKLGATLVLAGFQQVKNSYDDGSGLFGAAQKTGKERNVIVIAIEVHDATGA